jgi:hypothetical protein
MPIDEMDNTSVDVEEVTDGDQNNSGSQNDDQDFLVVNDRTRFRSADDAIKSFNEAGERIKVLSGWEKEIKDRFGVSDPQTAAALLQELADRREAERVAAAAPKPKPAATTQTDDEEGLSTEDAQALKWLKKHAPRLGFVPKEELTTLKDELQKQIEELRTGNSEASQQVFEAQRNALVDSGRESLKGWMATEKIVDNAKGEKQLVIESLVRDWVNGDPTQERGRRFFASPSESRAVVKEGFDKAIELLGWKTVGTNSSNSSSHAMSKGAALARNAKRMPQNGQASRAQSNSGKPQTRVDAGGRKDYIGTAHNDAWEVAQKHFAGHSAE